MNHNGVLCPKCGLESICNGLGIYTLDVDVDDPRFGKVLRCPNNPVELDEDRRERFRELSNLGAFADKSFANFETHLHGLTPAQMLSLETALGYAMRFAERPDGWLLLEGTYGCGKTHLAAAIGNERLNHGDMVLFVTAPDLLDHLRSTYGPTSEIGYDQMFDRISNASLLLIDDLGAENPSSWAQEKLFQLLNYRYSHRLPTVITTNVDLDRFDPRVRSRLLDQKLTHHVQITAPDYRTPGQSYSHVIGDLANYTDMTFETFDAHTRLNTDQRQSVQYALDVSRAYANNPQGWLVIFGEFGVGKTHLAASIAHVQHQRGKNVIFVTVPNLLDYLREAFKPDAPMSFGQLFNTVRDAPMLVLDDLSTENASSWAKEKLFQIVDHRYTANLPTVITTAAQMEALDRRVVSRMKDQRRCMNILIKAPDYPTRITQRP
jgi:DNA replication protein DnaC